jgi:dTDP-glucose 4,6-dehydratase
MKIKGKTILVTGSDGFIGSHLVEALAQQDCHVKAFVYYNSFNHWGWLEQLPKNLLNQIEIITGDIRDPFLVNQATQGCDIVMHLASLIAIPYSYIAPQHYMETNIQGTLNILQAAREHHVSKLIHTSTSEVYGSAQYVPIDEKHPLQGQSPYSATKIAADQLALSFFNSFSLPVSIMRPFNTYGPRQSARAFIPTLITQILNQQTSIQLGSLHPTRDFNFVADTVAGFIAMAESDAVNGETINFGSGVDIAVGEVAKLISEIMQRPVEFTVDPQRVRPENSEVQRLLACNKKAKALTTWNPQYHGIAGLQKGLEQTIAWFSEKEHLNHYKAGIYNL